MDRKISQLAVAQQPKRLEGVALGWQQLLALTRKNALIRREHCRRASRGEDASSAFPPSTLAGGSTCPSAALPWCRGRAWKINLLLVAQAVLFTLHNALEAVVTQVFHFHINPPLTDFHKN